MNHEEKDQALETALRAAFQRESPPLGFTQRVEAQLAAQDRALSIRKHFWLRLATAAVLMLAIILPLGLRLRHQTEVARGEAAKAQLLLALRITGTQLRTIQARTQTRHPGITPEGDSQ